MKLTQTFNRSEPIGDTEFHYSVKDGVATICFNGSERIRDSLMDWLLNFAAWRWFRRDYKGKVYIAHWGFMKRWVLVKPLVENLIDNTAPDSIELSGYSLGAGLATYCHHWIKQEYPGLPIKTVVAGSPKMFGWLGYKRQAERCKDIISLIYGNDIVTKVPFFMRHVGHIHFKGTRNWGKLNIPDHYGVNYWPMMTEINKQES